LIANQADIAIVHHLIPAPLRSLLAAAFMEVFLGLLSRPSYTAAELALVLNNILVEFTSAGRELNLSPVNDVIIDGYVSLNRFLHD